LLVAERGGDRDAAEQVAQLAALDLAVDLGGGADLRQHRGGHADGLGDLLVPLHGVQVHQHGAGGVGDVRDVAAAVGAAGQVPDDPGAYSAEVKFATIGASFVGVGVDHQRTGYRAGEVGEERENSLAAAAVLANVAAQPAAEGVSAVVLPDGGVVDGLHGDP